MSTKWRIAIAQSDEHVRGCFAVMRELRTHLDDQEQFVRQVREQRADGYELAFLDDGTTVRAVAGFRIFTCLSDGKTLHVDDLVTDAEQRSQGFGAALFDWLVIRAREQGCDTLRLDSGVQRFAAHRFYLRQRMSIVAHHFTLRL